MFENRLHYRLPLNQKYIVGFPHGVYAGTCVNISSGGCFVNLLETKGIQLNDTCRCVFITHAGAEPTIINASVKRVVSPSPNPETLAGVALQFDEKEQALEAIYNSIEEMRNQYELISTILGHGEPDISTLQPILQSLSLKPFMDLGELNQYVERILRAVELVEDRKQKND